ncbi:unnamed protein product [Prunus brigantina]
MGVSSFAIDNHCLEIATNQLHGSGHSAILIELRDTIQSDAAMDHIIPRHFTNGSFFICHRQPLSGNSYRSTSLVSSLCHPHGVEGYNTE